MPTKKGAGGHQQNYDSRTGRFAKMDYTKLFPPKEPTRKEKARKKEAQRREALFNRARNSRDPLLFDVFCAIEAEFPGEIKFVNEIMFDAGLGRPRELDIITQKCIIEVKTGRTPKGLTQFLGQKRFAESKNKRHIVFAPDITSAAKRAHEQSGIVIIKDYKTLFEKIKESLK